MKIREWCFVAVLTVALLWALSRPYFPDDESNSAVIVKASQETRQVGLAAKLFADEHQGHLPNALDELVPAYLPDKKFLQGTQLAAPGAVLAQLRPESVVLFRVATDGRRHLTRVVLIHPDLNVEWKRP